MSDRHGWEHTVTRASRAPVAVAGGSAAPPSVAVLPSAIGTGAPAIPGACMFPSRHGMGKNTLEYECFYHAQVGLSYRVFSVDTGARCLFRVGISFVNMLQHLSTLVY